MRELEVLFKAAPQLLSVVGIFGVLIFIAVKVTLFYNRFRTMEGDVADMRVKIDKIMDYLITGKAEVLKK